MKVATAYPEPPAPFGAEAKNDPTALIRIRNISKSYRIGKLVLQVLDSISVDFEKSCFTAIAGPSGSGKSTLLNILGCLDLPDRGEYWLDDQLISRYDKVQLASLRRNKFGFIFQTFNLLPVLTAVENVELPLSLFDIPRSKMRSRAMELLADVGMADKAGHKPSELSGGQQQRVAIARALVTNPDIVFADEPTANLDSKTGEKIINVMRELNERRGVAFIFASHDVAIIKAAIKVYHLGDGILTI